MESLRITVKYRDSKFTTVVERDERYSRPEQVHMIRERLLKIIREKYEAGCQAAEAIANAMRFPGCRGCAYCEPENRNPIPTSIDDAIELYGEDYVLRLIAQALRDAD
jgi:hypothetical protein